MSKQETKTQWIKAIDQYTAKVYYGRVTHSTKCYVTVTIKNFYGKDRPMTQKLFKRETAMTCDTSSLNFYFIYPEEVTG
jgi:hypothetical protein